MRQNFFRHAKPICKFALREERHRTPSRLQSGTNNKKFPAITLKIVEYC